MEGKEKGEKEGIWVSKDAHEFLQLACYSFLLILHFLTSRHMLSKCL